MSISFWKMSPSIVFLGGREEAEWLDKHFSADPCGQASTFTVSDDQIKSAEESAKEFDKTLDERIFSEKMLKKMTDMLVDHKKTQAIRKLANPDDTGGEDWFEISISW